LHVASLIQDKVPHDVSTAVSWNPRRIGNRFTGQRLGADRASGQRRAGRISCLGANDRLEVFMDIDNALNLIDGEWNTFRTKGSFSDGQLVDLVDGTYDSQGRYVISDFNPDDDPNVSVSSSARRIQIGARYEF
jgi:hypothetical protein